MASQALYRKWRPQVWDDVVAQEQVTRVLQNAIRTDRVAHAYLFSGPRGTGKTTMARILARAVNCLDPSLENRPCDQCENCIAVNNGQFMDLIEIDAASNTSVDDIRDLRDKIGYAPGKGRMKVYIIDEVHMLSTAAFNALLKTLEEPPSHAMFILATTEIHKIPATVLSRCQHYEFRRIPVKDIMERLEKICNAEGIDYEIEALMLIARQSTGAMRDAISMLDQMASTGSKITLQSARNILGIATSQSVIGITEAMITKDTASGMEALHKALDAGTDPRQLARQQVDYLRQLLVIKMGTHEILEITEDVKNVLEMQCEKISIDRIVKAIRLFNNAANDSKIDWNPGLSMELAFAESCEEEKTVEQQVIHVIEKQAADETESEKGKETAAQTEDEAYLQHRVFIRKGAPPPDSSVTLAEISQKWDSIRTLIRQYDPVLDAALNHARLLEVREGILYLGFPRETIMKKVEENHRFLVWTSAAISKVLGKSVGVSLLILGKQIQKTQVPIKSEAVDAALQLGGKLVTDKK